MCAAIKHQMAYTESMQRLGTSRLILRDVSTDDAVFMLKMLNDPRFIRYIGDRGVRSTGDAEQYISENMLASYKQYGFGMYVVVRKTDPQNPPAPIGICGLVKRPGLNDVDIGFAFLPEFCGYGYAIESAKAVMHHAQYDLGLNKVVAITSPDNQNSTRLLEKLEFEYVKMIGLPNTDDQVRLYSWLPANESEMC